MGNFVEDMNLCTNAFSIIKLLQKYKDSINNVCKCGCAFTALHMATQNDKYDLVRMLLDNAKSLNLDVNKQSRDGTAFRMAISKQNLTLIKLFMDRLKIVGIDPTIDRAYIIGMGSKIPKIYRDILAKDYGIIDDE